MKKVIATVTMILTIFLSSPSIYASQLDLSNFSPDGDVSVAGTIFTIDETSGYWSSYFYNDNFAVAGNAISLTFDYSLSSSDNDFDWLVMMVDDGSGSLYDLEVTGTQSGSHYFDLTPYQGNNISLTFGLEAGMADAGFDSVATFSNFDISCNAEAVPTPIPGTLVLLGGGLIGLVGASKMKLFNKF